MQQQTNIDSQEQRIVAAAKQIFIDNGFAETRMGDIAEKVGINRTGLHYYFRTKDKLFQAVSKDIICSLVPRIKETIFDDHKTIGERVAQLVDIYYSVYFVFPNLPLFIFKEINRDSEHLFSAIKEFQIVDYYEQIIAGLHREMNAGRMKQVPLRFVFFTFYSLLNAPFTLKKISPAAFLNDGETFKDMAEKWKPYIVQQMEALLKK